MMLGTPLLPGSRKILLLGGGELGKEIGIEAQRLGVETVVVDRYSHCPASQVAHRSYTINMLDGSALKAIVRREHPDAIVPEVESINTDALVELEEEGYTVIPSARATQTTMDRITIRKLASERAGVRTSPYAFAYNEDELRDACDRIGYPCIVKSRMSSGGLGSSVVTSSEQIPQAYEISKRLARGRGDQVIVEGLVSFDLEVTELVVLHDTDGSWRESFPVPVGHLRFGGHYHASWQPFLQPGKEFQGFGSRLQMEEEPNAEGPKWSSKWNGRIIDWDRVAKLESMIYETASKVARALPEPKLGHKKGIFGCELFIKLGEEGGEPEVYFNEVSPRPHDTGMVTLATQDVSEMGLHVRAILGLPIPCIRLLTPGAAHVVLAQRNGAWGPKYSKVVEPLSIPGVHLKLFGKPFTYRERRMGLALALHEDVNEARRNAMKAAHLVEEGMIYD